MRHKSRAKKDGKSLIVMCFGKQQPATVVYITCSSTGWS